MALSRMAASAFALLATVAPLMLANGSGVSSEIQDDASVAGIVATAATAGGMHRAIPPAPRMARPDCDFETTGDFIAPLFRKDMNVAVDSGLADAAPCPAVLRTQPFPPLPPPRLKLPEFI